MGSLAADLVTLRSAQRKSERRTIGSGTGEEALNGDMLVGTVDHASYKLVETRFDVPPD